jgi:hypothetical protein
MQALKAGDADMCWHVVRHTVEWFRCKELLGRAKENGAQQESNEIYTLTVAGILTAIQI